VELNGVTIQKIGLFIGTAERTSDETDLNSLVSVSDYIPGIQPTLSPVLSFSNIMSISVY
jgi:hypothetical protein